MSEEANQALQPEDASQADSATFSRCAWCKHAAEVDTSAGALLCQKHNMRVNAEADEIPDDCVEFEPLEGENARS